MAGTAMLGPFSLYVRCERDDRVRLCGYADADTIFAYSPAQYPLEWRFYLRGIESNTHTDALILDRRRLDVLLALFGVEETNLLEVASIDELCYYSPQDLQVVREVYERMTGTPPHIVCCSYSGRPASEVGRIRFEDDTTGHGGRVIVPLSVHRQLPTEEQKPGSNIVNLFEYAARRSAR